MERVIGVRRFALSRHVFALFLFCYPRAFRRRFGDDMRELFDDQLRAAHARGGVLAVAALWLRTLPGLARVALAETYDTLRDASRRPFTAAGSRAAGLPHTRGDNVLATLLSDLRFAFRMLRKSPVFTIVSVVCISIGSGAVTTIFSAMNALVLRPLPGATDPTRLLRLERKAPAQENGGVSASYPLYEFIRSQTRTLDGVAAWGKAALTLRSGSGEGVSVYGSYVSGDFFAVLGVHPLLGRFFAPSETRTELANPVIVVSERFWRSKLGSDSAAVGRDITVNGHPYTLVGVAPHAFEGLDAPVQTDAWVPLMMQAQLRLNAGPLESNDVTWLHLCGRLKPGVSAETARRELAGLTESFAKQGVEPAAYRMFTDMHVSALTGLPPDASGPLTMFLALLLSAAALVLLIASVNVASMLGARAIARRREMAVRAALGASRGRLVRQLLTEILVLFGLGAFGGTLLAMLATGAAERVNIPSPVPFAFELSPDWRVMTFALVVSLLAGLIFGLSPALQAASTNIATRMRTDSDGGGTRRTRLGSVLVVGQLAMSLLLLVGAGLFLRALDRGSHIDPGFDPSGVATANLDTESWGYDNARGQAFYERLRERVSALPGVTAVSYSVFLPLTMHSNGTNIQVDGGDGSNVMEGVFSNLLKVDADYFAAVRMPLVAGRPFVREDNAGSPKVVVVNETLARRYFPGENALGRMIGYGGNRWRIIGITRDAKYSNLAEITPPFVYFPMAQDWEPKHSLLVRTSSVNPLALAPAIVQAIRDIDPALPRPVVTTLRSENAIVLIPQRVAAIVTASLGGVGILLAAVGLYGVVAYSASRRSREIGIRLALGARPVVVQRMVVSEGMRLSVTGVVIGLVLAAGVTRLLVSFLFGISPLDGATFVLMSLLFLGIAAVASYLPARRAAAVDPMVVLRGE